MVSQQFLPQDSSTLANFKAWASSISGFFTTIGWTKTTDSGQVNWSTISAVPASGSTVYEVWQPGDVLQTGATAYYLRIQYGTTSSSGVVIQVQLGTSTNGAGVLTGATTTAMLPTAGNGASGGAASTYECDFSGDTGRIGMLLWRTAPQPGSFAPGMPVAILIERTLSTTGSAQSDGVTLVVLAGQIASLGQNISQQTIAFVGGAAIQTNTPAYYNALSNGRNASAAFSGNVPFSPIFPEYGLYSNPMTVGGFVHTQDVAEGTTFTTTQYGATRTYLATARIALNYPASCAFCMRYD